MLWCSAELLKARRALICRCEPRAPWKTLLWAVLGSKVSSPHAAAHVCRGLGQFISSFCRSEAVYFIYCLACLSSSLYLGTPEVALLIPNAQESSRRFSRDASKIPRGARFTPSNQSLPQISRSEEPKALFLPGLSAQSVERPHF